MFNRKQKHAQRPIRIATAADYERGRHSRWEAVLHEFDQRHKQLGMDVSSADRCAFIDSWLANHGVSDWEEIVDCSVCQEWIAECMLRNENPWTCPEQTKRLIKLYAERMHERTHLDLLIYRANSGK